MKLSVAAGLLCALTVYGQSENSGGALGGLFQGMIQGRRLKMEEQNAQAARDLENAKTENLRLENERLRREMSGDARASAIARQFDVAMTAVRNRFADFDMFAGEASRLMTALDPNAPGFSLEHYIEGMYFIAKYATFSAVASPSPAGLLVREPAFYTVPMPVRISLLRAVEPQARNLSDGEVEKIISAVAEKLHVAPDAK